MSMLFSSLIIIFIIKYQGVGKGGGWPKGQSFCTVIHFVEFLVGEHALDEPFMQACSSSSSSSDFDWP